MAITFIGSAKSYNIIGNDSITQDLFVIENGYQSRVNVNIREIHILSDYTGALTAVSPIVRVSRCSGVSGGTKLVKSTFDTTQTSDPNVVFRAPVIESERLTATAGNTIWQEFLVRQHTQVGQNYYYDKDVLPALTAETGKELKLRPGESILVEVKSAAGTSNPAISNNFIVACNFEEDSISTFTISGTVTLNSVGVEGAKVMVIEADDTSLTNSFLREVITTPAGGAWSSTIRTGKVGAAFVQYTSGGVLYTAPGSPYLQ